MRNPYYSDRDFRRIRFVALFVSVIFHGVLFLGLLYYEYQLSNNNKADVDVQFGGSGGGGGEGAEDDAIQFGPQGSTESRSGKEIHYSPQFNLIQIHVYNDLENANPISKKEVKQFTSTKKKKQKPILAENLPTRWVRRGTGPGSGGGAGGGSGGGIGAGQGYSIDWGGTGSRRLLSGRLPRYPEGTDKEMPVTLEFTVLPGGSVSGVVPLYKSDESLEREAMAALQTWRFESLPPQLEQKTQIGRITFKFILKKER